jgi:hypothetical protein
MYDERMEKLREKLNEMIMSGEYKQEEILKVSEELDFLIIQSMKRKSRMLSNRAGMDKKLNRYW